VASDTDEYTSEIRNLRYWAAEQSRTIDEIKAEREALRGENVRLRSIIAAYEVSK